MGERDGRRERITYGDVDDSDAGVEMEGNCGRYRSPLDPWPDDDDDAGDQGPKAA